MKKPKYILDSYALLAYFQAEPAGVKVRKILKDAMSHHVVAYLSVISLGEIYYCRVNDTLSFRRSLHN